MNIPFTFVPKHFYLHNKIELISIIIHYESFDYCFCLPTVLFLARTLFFHFVGFSLIVSLSAILMHTTRSRAAATPMLSRNVLSSSLEHSFYYLNYGSATFMVCPSQAKFAINLSFVSPSLIGMGDWSVIFNTHFIDHFPIMIFLNYSIKKLSFFLHRIRLSSENKKFFTSNLMSVVGHRSKHFSFHIRSIDTGFGWICFFPLLHAQHNSHKKISTRFSVGLFAYT